MHSRDCCQILGAHMHSNKFEFQVDLSEFCQTMYEMAPAALTHWCAHQKCLQKQTFHE